MYIYRKGNSRMINYISGLLLGFLIATIIQFKHKDNEERFFFESIAQSVRRGRIVFNEDSSIVDALHVTNHLLKIRSQLFERTNTDRDFLNDGSLSEDLLTAKGACASYASVLGELLQTMGFQIRIAQMKVGNKFGGHIITEVLTSNGWAVLDASCDLFFTNPQHKLASFKEVSGNWEYYKSQTGKGYEMPYKYSDVRYTNWDKIPVVMPLLRKILVLTIGSKKVDTISLRSFVLRRYRVYYLLLLLMIGIYSMVILIKRAIGIRLKILSPANTRVQPGSIF